MRSSAILRFPFIVARWRALSPLIIKTMFQLNEKNIIYKSLQQEIKIIIILFNLPSLLVSRRGIPLFIRSSAILRFPSNAAQCKALSPITTMF